MFDLTGKCALVTGATGGLGGTVRFKTAGEMSVRKREII